MSRGSTEHQRKKRERLAQFAKELRFQVFETATDAGQHFNRAHTTITRYEKGETKELPLGYLACLMRLHDERCEQAGDIDNNRRETLLQQIRKAIVEFYPREQPFRDWQELSQAADDFMKQAWGDNWSVEIARRRGKTRIGNIPPRRKGFIGYEDEVETLLAWLSTDYRRVFIEGIDGVGKTWIALEVGNRCLTGRTMLFEAGIWISAKDHPHQKLWLEEVLNTVARELRYPHLVQLPLGVRQIKVNELLGRYGILLIIDNFNTIEDPNLEDWLRQTPRKSKVLITSRYTQTSLVSDDTRSIRLGGLITLKALEFIRTCARDLGVYDLVSVPDADLFPLVEASAGNPQIMRLALGDIKYVEDWRKAVDYVTEREKIWERKWELLTKDARQVLIVTPFFADSMSRNALNAAAGLEGFTFYEALKQLENIQVLDVQEIQIYQQPHVRYSIHPTVRAFATSRLKSAAEFENQARKRWAHHFINFAKEYLVDEEVKEPYWQSLVHVELAPIDREWPNFKEVLRWVDENQQDLMLVELMLALIHSMDSLALYSERIKYTGQAAAAALRLGKLVVAAYFYTDGLAWIHIEEHHFEAAFQQIDKGLAIARSDGVTQDDTNNLITLAHTFRARAFLENGQIEKAAEELSQILSIECSPEIRSRVCMVAGEIAYKEANYAEAIRFYQAGIDAIEHSKSKFEVGSLLYRLGFAHLGIKGKSNLDEAEKAFNQLLAVHRPNITLEVISAEFGLAQVAKQRGSISEARTLAKKAYENLVGMYPGHWRLREIEEFQNELQQLAVS